MLVKNAKTTLLVAISATVATMLAARAVPRQVCGNAFDVNWQDAWIHSTHATPWTLQDPPAGFGTCPNTSASGLNAECQVSTKIVSENNSAYFGLRFKDDDIYTNQGCVGGTNATFDDGEARLVLSVIATQTTATEGVGNDYTLWEIDGTMPNMRLVPSGPNNEFTINIEQNQICTMDYVDPGVSLLLLARINDDNPGGVEPLFEFVEVEFVRAEVDVGNTGNWQTIDVGWNHRMRWIIENLNP